MNANFSITIETNASAGQSISAVDAFVDFDPTYLEVVDSDASIAGIQIAPGSQLPNVLNNTVDNSVGHIDFSAGKLSGTPPAGSFLVATITFRPRAETPGTNTTPITFSLSGARKSLAAYSSNAVPGTHQNSAVDIDTGATINGQITLQGGSRPAAARAVSLTVKLFVPGANVKTATPVASYTTSTVDTGSNNVTFQISGVAPGTYDISVSAGRTLLNAKRNVVVSLPSVTVIFGTLLEGDSNDDGIINAVDFSILATSYLKSIGQLGFDVRADFDKNGAINALDFSALAANYLKNSPIEV